MSVSDEINEFLNVHSTEILKKRAEKIMERNPVELPKDIKVSFSKFTALPKKKVSDENTSASIVRFEPFINEPPRCSADEILKALEELLKPPKHSPFGIELFFCPGPDDYVRQTSKYFGYAFMSSSGRVFENGNDIGTPREYVERWRREHNITE